MKKIDEGKIFELAKKVEESSKEADLVNIGILPMEDLYKLVTQKHNLNELINYILGLDSEE